MLALTAWLVLVAGGGAASLGLAAWSPCFRSGDIQGHCETPALEVGRWACLQESSGLKIYLGGLWPQVIETLGYEQGPPGLMWEGRGVRCRVYRPGHISGDPLQHAPLCQMSRTAPFRVSTSEVQSHCSLSSTSLKSALAACNLPHWVGSFLSRVTDFRK